ncbi:MAG: gamma-glutamylcyclotransferase [Chloroflexi bacterium]|nr:gamma-glutamylcyclotransferase [Chloroflexota bacterium]
MAHLFVYGSLTRPTTLDAVLGHRHLGERFRARLPGWERRAVRDFEYPVVVPSAGGVVDGILVFDLSDEDLACLDQYEDLATGEYVRQEAIVEAEGCGPAVARLPAFVYAAGPALAPRLEPGSQRRL